MMNIEPDWDKLYKKQAKEKEDFKNVSYIERLELMLKFYCRGSYTDVIEYCKNGGIKE